VACSFCQTLTLAGLRWAAQAAAVLGRAAVLARAAGLGQVEELGLEEVLGPAVEYLDLAVRAAECLAPAEVRARAGSLAALIAQTCRATGHRWEILAEDRRVRAPTCQTRRDRTSAMRRGLHWAALAVLVGSIVLASVITCGRPWHRKHYNPAIAFPAALIARELQAEAGRHLAISVVPRPYRESAIGPALVAEQFNCQLAEIDPVAAILARRGRAEAAELLAVAQAAVASAAAASAAAVIGRAGGLDRRDPAVAALAAAESLVGEIDLAEVETAEVAAFAQVVEAAASSGVPAIVGPVAEIAPIGRLSVAAAIGQTDLATVISLLAGETTSSEVETILEITGASTIAPEVIGGRRTTIGAIGTTTGTISGTTTTSITTTIGTTARGTTTGAAAGTHHWPLAQSGGALGRGTTTTLTAVVDTTTLITRSRWQPPLRRTITLSRWWSITMPRRNPPVGWRRNPSQHNHPR